jgi:hypothetical protein
MYKVLGIVEGLTPLEALAKLKELKDKKTKEG